MMFRGINTRKAELQDRIGQEFQRNLHLFTVLAFTIKFELQVSNHTFN